MCHPEKFDNYTDEELVRQIRHGMPGRMDYLLQRYKGLVRKMANQYFLIGADNEDLVQEGMIGLFKAIQTYSPERSCSFYTFAARCIQGEMHTAIRSSQSKKHQPLNNYESISQTTGEKFEEVEKRLMTWSLDPERQVLDSEFYEDFSVRLKKKLSRKEWEVMRLFWKGMGRREIAQRLGFTDKTTDNALNRGKSKIRQIIEELA